MSNNGANLGFEQKLWSSADKLRSNMDAAEYKHVVLGLIFLKYISDAFTEVYEKLKKEKDSDPEDVDEYVSRRIFFVPKESRWENLQANAKKPELGEFASAEGKKGGQFYTPRSIVKLLTEMLEPYKGRIFDPCCGSGGMFVQSEKFVEAHGGKIKDISVYGQESNQTTWKLCKMNMAIRGIDSNIKWGDAFHDDQHKDLKADFILANPPFNDSDWNGELLQEDVRWKFGVPPKNNANFAWVQHFIHHLNPTGVAGFVLANGSMSSNTSNEGEIRKNIVEADLVDCIVTMPAQL